MSKVLFVIKYPLIEQYSIMQKLNGEINAVRQLGNEVFYISFDHDHLYLDNGQERKMIQKTTMGKMPGYFHTFVFYDIYRAARKVLLKEQFDLVYFRYSPLSRSGYRMTKTAFEKSKLVVEIPTFPPDIEKAKNPIRELYQRYSAFRWTQAAKHVTLFTGIGEPGESYLGVPFLNIDNGIDTQLIPLRVPREPEDGKMHILAVAAMCNWHGYDRLIQGFANWNNPKKQNYIIDMVGDEGDGSLEKWKKLTADCGLEKQVIFHGKMTGEPLTKMFEMAEIGCGSFGLYRNNLRFASVLKIREYMARGLPFLYAHDDPGLTGEYPWCIQFPNDDTPIDMDRVDAFVSSLKRNQGLEKQMRAYAEEHMTWEAQFRKVFEKLETLSESGGR